MTAPVFIIIPRVDVEAGRLAPFLKRFGGDVLPEGPALREMMGSLTFSILGYESDPDELYSIQAARDYYAKLLVDWPYWLFFCELHTESLLTMTMCVMSDLQGHKVAGTANAMIRYDPTELIRFIRDQFLGMNFMCQRAGMSGEEICRRSDDVFAYYGFETGS